MNENAMHNIFCVTTSIGSNKSVKTGKEIMKYVDNIFSQGFFPHKGRILGKLTNYVKCLVNGGL